MMQTVPATAAGHSVYSSASTTTVASRDANRAENEQSPVAKYLVESANYLGDTSFLADNLGRLCT